MKFREWVAAQGDQKIVARRLGVSVSAICRWVKGNRVPSFENIVKIERVSEGKVTFEDFIPQHRALSKKRSA